MKKWAKISIGALFGVLFLGALVVLGFLGAFFVQDEIADHNFQKQVRAYEENVKNDQNSLKWDVFDGCVNLYYTVSLDEQKDLEMRIHVAYGKNFHSEHNELWPSHMNIIDKDSGQSRPIQKDLDELLQKYQVETLTDLVRKSQLIKDEVVSEIEAGSLI